LKGIKLKLITKWLTRKIINFIKQDPIFIDFIDDKIMRFYKKESLKCARIWGDESKLHLGQNVQVNNALINTISGDVFVDDFAFFGHSVTLLTGTHDHKMKDASRQNSVPISGRDIHVGRGVWIGSNATVIGPSQIGAYTVIAAGSVLIGNAESCSIYAGIPAVKVKELKNLNHE
jgi:acetyltransferase-like isoleucine patch superfamily enzyme